MSECDPPDLLYLGELSESDVAVDNAVIENLVNVEVACLLELHDDVVKRIQILAV